METVDVLVRIPKEDFDFIKDEFADGDMPDDKDLKETTYFAIAKGKVLPKGYGRLIDAKALEDAMYHEAFEVDSDMQKWDSGNWIRYKMFENAIRDAKTIVEADKGF